MSDTHKRLFLVASGVDMLKQIQTDRNQCTKYCTFVLNYMYMTAELTC